MSDAVKEINVSMATLKDMAKGAITPAKRHDFDIEHPLMVDFDGKSGILSMLSTDRRIIVENWQIVAPEGEIESFRFYMSADVLDTFCKTKSSVCTIGAEGLRAGSFAAFPVEDFNSRYEELFGMASKLLRETWEDQEYWKSKEVDTGHRYVGVNIDLIAYLKGVEVLPRGHFANAPIRFANRNLHVRGIVMPAIHIDA